MSVFLPALGFELRYYFGRISTHVYFLTYFALAFLMTSIMGGAFEEIDAAVGGAGGQIDATAPYPTAALMGSLGLFAVPIIAALLGNAVYRDYEAGSHPLFFTTPVSERTFLLTRFCGAWIVGAYVLASIPIAQALAAVMPFLDAERVGPFLARAYWPPYVLLLLPTLTFAGAGFFGLAAFTRSMLPNYLGGVLLLVGYLLAGTLIDDLDDKTLAGMLDPFGIRAFGVVTEYWTPAEKNSSALPAASLLGLNRLVWIGVGLAVLALCVSRFRFAQAAADRGRKAPAADAAAAEQLVALDLPPVPHDFSLAASFRQFLTVARQAVRSIVRNVYFPAIVGAGVLFLVFGAREVGRMYDTTTWPVTYQVLELLGGTFALFNVVVLALYAGELVWQERDLKLSQVTDALPIRDWVMLLGKLAGLIAVIAGLQLVVLVAGVITQAASGYFRFELPLYLKVLLGIQLHGWILTAVLAFFVHVIVDHKYFGHVLVILLFFLTGFLGSLGFEHHLYLYGTDPGWQYSDMNRFGPFVPGLVGFGAYWSAVALLLLLGARLLWVRGFVQDFRARLRLARGRLGRGERVLAAIGGAATLALGGWLFYGTNVVNHYRTSYDRQTLQAEYEKTYRQYHRLPQPRVTGVDVEVDLFPNEGSIELRGRYVLKNRTGEPIPKLHVLLPEEAIVREATFDPPATLELEDTLHGYRIYAFETPLAPEAEVGATFAVGYRPEGIRNEGPSTAVVENGTFVNSGLMPSFGYSEQGELSDDDTRRKHGLEPKPRMHPIDDLRAHQDNYISHDADFVTFAATVSTEPDQIALAPGYLVREWEENGRRKFRYEMDAPILNFWSVLSARWEVKRDRWNDVAIEIYYHRGHEYNVDRMIESIKRTLEYCTAAFGPYQHKQARILEFPRYATFAQSFPNTIPYSEGIGFIARLDDEEDIDYTFYVTAHEIAHQWFAHQIVGADVQGATVLTETLSQYAALMVMEREYGTGHMRRFLAHELDRYLGGRAFERKREWPLVLNENQQYIHYAKGSLVTYALRDYLGEDAVNRAIAGLLDRTRFKGPPYPTGVDLLDAVHEVAPAELDELVEDLMNRITIYELKAESATHKALPDGRFEVTLSWTAKKYDAAPDGAETEVDLDLPIDVGVFAEGPTPDENDDEPLFFEKKPVKTGAGELTVVVDKEPARAGIDPYHKLVDRKIGDNLVKVKPAEG